MLDEQLFRAVLLREEKRAERFARPLCVVLVCVDGLMDRETPLFLNRAVDSLAAAMRQSDVMGWLKSNSVLGLILSDVSQASAEKLRDRFERALQDRLGSPLSMQVSLRADPAEPGDRTDRHELIERQHPKQRRGRRLYAPLKRACDVVGSATSLILLSPLFLVIAVLVKLSSRGPVLFRQERVGHRGMPFTMFKFRTMIAGADPLLHQRFMSRFIRSREGNPATPDDAPFKIRDDPRVTKFGHVLRTTSCDELPQLLNVLRGEMSLVGPRPALEYEVQQYEPWQRRRIMEVKPGITGLWQVNGRSRTTFEQMVRLDLHYAKTCSLWGDLKILLATPAAVLSGKGAR